MSTRKTITVSLPDAMAEQVENAMRVEQRTRSELVREALREYLNKPIPVVAASRTELAAIRRGRTEIEKGDYVTLDELPAPIDAPIRASTPQTSPGGYSASGGSVGRTKSPVSDVSASRNAMSCARSSSVISLGMSRSSSHGLKCPPLRT